MTGRKIRDIDLKLPPSHRLKKTYRDEKRGKTIRVGTYAWIGAWTVHFVYKNGDEMKDDKAKKLQYPLKGFEPLRRWFRKA